MCGGNGHLHQPRPYRSGLSPRVRGKRVEGRYGSIRPGSIPACAGETENDQLVRLHIPVYPRVCGGNDIIVTPRRTAPGLSPRVRGKRQQRNNPGNHRQPIPACAGETRLRFPLNGAAETYPRVCGGNSSGVRLIRPPGNLSPRVRGKRQHKPGVGIHHKPIPACAGETRFSGTRPISCATYPRVCGGNMRSLMASAVNCNLSPRVRGKLTVRRPSAVSAEPIPACAGETRYG